MHYRDLLRVAVEPLEEARLIRAAGEIDLSTAAQLGRVLDAARAESATTVLDLSEITFIDSSGIHVLVEASRGCAATGWAFFIVRPSEPVRRLIQLTGTADRLNLVDPVAHPEAADRAWAVG